MRDAGIRKTVAILVLAALTVSLTGTLSACARNRGNEEKTSGSYGFKEYSVDPKDESKRHLTEEYENLGTERTWKCYDDDGEVEEIRKEYYDSTGEHLLKLVRWGKNWPTKACEYDMLGRLVTVSGKYEEGFDPAAYEGVDHGLSLPTDYLNALNLYDWRWISLSVDRSIRELRTEYTYREDTEVIESICTKTETGEVVGSMERGEGEIILSAMMLCDRTRYEETYDETSQKSQWKLVNGENPRDPDDGDITYTGEREYDSSGRCIWSDIYSKDSWDSYYQANQCEYGESGYFKNSYQGTDRQNKDILDRIYYDYEDRPLVYQWYSQTDDGRSYMYMSDTIEYDKEGRETSSTYEYWDKNGDREGNTVRYEAIWEDNDSETIWTEYRIGNADAPMEQWNRQLFRKIITEITEEPGGPGRVTHEINMSYDQGEVQSTLETYSVSMPDRYDWDEETEVEYSKVYTDKSSGEYVPYRTEAEFYESGRLWKTAEKTYYYISSSEDMLDSAEYCEYDERGLLCRRHSIEMISGEETITVWEYWGE